MGRTFIPKERGKFQNNILEIENPLMTGFYGYSILNPGEEGNKLELDEKYNLIEDGIKRDIYDDWEIGWDNDEYETEVLKEINYLLINKINNAINYMYNIKKFLKSHCCDVLTCPEEYNFEKDRGFFKSRMNGNEYIYVMNRFFKENKDFIDEYLYERFTSREGFMSNYPNNWNEWYENIQNFDYVELGVLMKLILYRFNDINIKMIKESQNDMLYGEEKFEICNNIWYTIDRWIEKKSGEKTKYYKNISGKVVKIRKPECIK